MIRPAIDPLSFKNRELSPAKAGRHPVQRAASALDTTRWFRSLRRAGHAAGPDGSFARRSRRARHRHPVPADRHPDLALGSPQGLRAAARGFVLLKGGSRPRRDLSERHRRRLAQVRLVLAGPDPAAVADDPEAQEVLAELIDPTAGCRPRCRRTWRCCRCRWARASENALMVNALQRCSSIVVQNSLREGFGLTVTEAMWKQCAVLGSRACGIRQQIRDGIDGRLVADAEDPEQSPRSSTRCSTTCPAGCARVAARSVACTTSSSCSPRRVAGSRRSSSTAPARHSRRRARYSSSATP